MRETNKDNLIWQVYYAVGHTPEDLEWLSDLLLCKVNLKEDGWEKVVQDALIECTYKICRPMEGSFVFHHVVLRDPSDLHEKVKVKNFTAALHRNKFLNAGDLPRLKQFEYIVKHTIEFKEAVEFNRKQQTK